MASKTQVRKAVQKYVFQRNRTHYLKWALTAEWSIRFIFTYDTRPEYTMTWVLKSHFKKIYIVLTKNEALEYIQKYSKAVEPLEYSSLNEFGKGYRRTVIDPICGTSSFIENKWIKK